MGYLKKALEEAAQNLVIKAQLEATYSNMRDSEIIKDIIGKYQYTGDWQFGGTLSQSSYEMYHEEGYKPFTTVANDDGTVSQIIDSTAVVVDDDTKLLMSPMISDDKSDKKEHHGRTEMVCDLAAKKP